jgi:putative peptide zinc metalloprotease protein
MDWPKLRDELSLLPGPRLADGQPSHTLHDPVRNLFFQIDWPSFEVLRRWHLQGTEAIATAISQETTLDMDANDVEAVAHFLDQNQLLCPGAGQAKALAQRLRKQRGSLSEQLLHNYLFFRIPLIKPDQWLQRHVDAFAIFYSKAFLRLTLAALLLGLMAIYRDWEQFTTTLVDTFTWSGLFSYGVALAFVKVLHELGHAVTAKRYGCKVPTMGLAFLVMWPVAYTDTNDVWRLTSRQQRLHVAAAGILTELIIAAWATLAWALLPSGQLQSMAFMLAATTWISSVAINASPFMRFDGYFLLADWLGMPNLHSRAFALARWDLRERLFALGDPAPEIFSNTRHRALILFAYATWAYRLVVFLGIAALVYTFFIKAVGIALFIIEMTWFVLLPPAREVMAWHRRWPQLQHSPRARRSLALAAMIVLLMFVPWPTRIATSGMLKPAHQWMVYAPAHARLSAQPIAAGMPVKAGTQLMRLASSELDSRQQAIQAQIDRLQWQSSAGSFDVDQRPQWQVAQEQLQVAQAELSALQVEQAHLAPVAPFDGVLHDIDPELTPGDWLSNKEPLASLSSDHDMQVVTFLDERDMALIKVGATAHFYTDGLGGPVLPMEVVRIDTDASRTLADGELASMYGGSIAVREKKGLLFPERAIYRVTLKPTADIESLAGHSWRGTVVIDGAWSAPAEHVFQSAAGLFWREAGF